VFAAILFVGCVTALLTAAWLHRRLSSKRRRLLWLAPWLLLVAALVATNSGFIVQKWLGRLAMPLGILWVGLIGMAVWLLRRGRYREGTAVVALLCLYWAACSTLLGAGLLRLLEGDFVAPPPSATEPYEAVFVLGGASSWRPGGEPQLGPSGDRITTAVRLYHAGGARQLVCSGTSAGGLRHTEDRSLALDVAKIMGELGVPSEAIVSVSGPRNTSEEIAALAALTVERRWQRVGLVTSAWHMRRALRLAARAGLDVTPIVADFRSSWPRTSIVELLPSAAGAYDVRLAAWELLGAAVGR